MGAPHLSNIGPVFARDGDDVIIKTNIQGGQAPFTLAWTLNDKVGQNKYFSSVTWSFLCRILCGATVCPLITGLAALVSRYCVLGWMMKGSTSVA